jgi:hypothetical protein
MFATRCPPGSSRLGDIVCERDGSTRRGRRAARRGPGSKGDSRSAGGADGGRHGRAYSSCGAPPGVRARSAPGHDQLRSQASLGTLVGCDSTTAARLPLCICNRRNGDGVGRHRLSLPLRRSGAAAKLPTNGARRDASARRNLGYPLEHPGFLVGVEADRWSVVVRNERQACPVGEPRACDDRTPDHPGTGKPHGAHGSRALFGPPRSSGSPRRP